MVNWAYFMCPRCSLCIVLTYTQLAWVTVSYLLFATHDKVNSITAQRWRHDMFLFCRLLAFYEGNPSVTSRPPSQWSGDAKLFFSFRARTNNQLHKQSICQWFEKLCRFCVVTVMLRVPRDGPGPVNNKWFNRLPTYLLPNLYCGTPLTKCKFRNMGYVTIESACWLLTTFWHQGICNHHIDVGVSELP